MSRVTAIPKAMKPRDRTVNRCRVTVVDSASGDEVGSDVEVAVTASSNTCGSHRSGDQPQTVATRRKANADAIRQNVLDLSIVE